MVFRWSVSTFLQLVVASGKDPLMNRCRKWTSLKVRMTALHFHKASIPRSGCGNFLRRPFFCAYNYYMQRENLITYISFCISEGQFQVQHNIICNDRQRV